MITIMFSTGNIFINYKYDNHRLKINCKKGPNINAIIMAMALDGNNYVA